ncbi:MAG TPA: methyltransferase domain-containing protein [Candidatus Polarisedimenticolia bacterium]|nr:methyltransferase domain-containing protein [Candidatus Polarisedimenticolia bacterium]
MADRETGENGATCEATRVDRQRIEKVYERYTRAGLVDGVWTDGPAARYIREVKWRTVEALAGARPGWQLGSWAVDMGAGRQSELADAAIGPRPAMAKVLAIDLLALCTAALARQPGVHPVLGHAAFLPLATGSIMVVYQSLMLSSVVDIALRGRIYREIARVTAPGGLFVSYDTRYSNPWNPDTRPVGLHELRDAFRGWRHRYRTLTVLPPVLRWIAPVSRRLCRAAEAIPPLRSHRLFVAEKPNEAAGAAR